MLATVALLLNLAVTNTFAETQKPCHLALASSTQKLSKAELAQRYEVKAEEILETAKNKIPTVLRKKTHETLAPVIPPNPILELQEYDVIIVGGGPSGLTSALYLTNAGKKVLVIEREDELGGLASGRRLSNGISIGTGTAYSAGPSTETQLKIFADIGLSKLAELYTIFESIDSYLWDGVVYEDVWHDHTLPKLPASFALFKAVLLELAENNYTDETLLRGIDMDALYMSDFVRKFPEIAARSSSEKVKEALKAFLEDPRVDRKDPMRVVLNLLDKYGPSALGGNASQVPSPQYGYFYPSEMRERFTSDNGTGFISEALLNTLKKGNRDLEIRLGSSVAEVDNSGEKARVTYVKNGQAFTARGKEVIFAAPLPLAPKLIKNFEKQDPAKAKAISQIKMIDYTVHVVHVKGHPFRQTYDLWVHNQDSTSKDPTDIINGRWMDSKIRGYIGMRNFEKDPEDDYGVFTLFHPDDEESAQGNYSKENSLKQTEQAVQWLHKVLDPIVAKNGQKIEVMMVESYRHVYGLPRMSLEHNRNKSVLSRGLKNIEFSNNTISVPELETAMELGYKAAMRILEREQSQEPHSGQTPERR